MSLADVGLRNFLVDNSIDVSTPQYNCRTPLHTHRDIKGANILVANDGTIKLVYSHASIWFFPRPFRFVSALAVHFVKRCMHIHCARRTLVPLKI